MERRKKISWCFFCFGASFLLLICGASTLSARENVVNAGIAARYDYQERDYDNADMVAENQGVVILDNRLGDERNYILSPRFSFSSTGIDDLFLFTISPSLNYDDLYSTTDLDWDFRAFEEKRFSRNWTVTLEDSYFLGDDPVREDALRTEEIVPGSIRVQELQVVGAPGEEDNSALTQRYGRTRFWTNNLLVSTEYTYAQDSSVGVGYGFGVLRNDGDENIYTEYDRHDIALDFSYRYNASWQLATRGMYSKGLFDEEDQPVGTAVESEDLDEYQFLGRLNYNKTPHLQFFGEYRYVATDFDSNSEEDYALHELIAGCDYDFSPQLSITLSAGPVIGSFENSSTDTDYVVYGGLDWTVEHGNLTLGVEKGYEQNDFDGRSTGLTDTWSANAAYTYQFTERFQGGVLAEYSNSDRMQITAIAAATENQTPEFGRSLYTEETYSGGVQFMYTFAQWYHLSAGYRYNKNESDLHGDVEGNYEEDLFFVELSWGKDLLHW